MLEEMEKLNKKSPLPLYYQLKEGLKKMIETGKLKPGDRIASERELCSYHEISRMTVNKAVEQLVQEEYLYREQGKGTFVAAKRQSRAISPLASFTAEMENQGLSASTVIKDWQRIEADRQLADRLKVNKGDEIYRLTRLRLIEGVPFLLETGYLPVILCPDLSRDDLENSSLYKILKDRYHYQLKRAEATVEPVLLSDEIAVPLETERGIMGLFFQQTTFLEEDRPIEYTEAYYRSDDYKFRLKFGFEQSVR